jgi:hypothetical protein
MGSPSRFLMGFPLPLPDASRGGGKRKWDRVPACRQRRTGAGGPQGRWAPLRGGLSAILDRHSPPCAKEGGRDGGMVHSIEHRDGRKGEHQFPCSFLGLCTLFEGTLITLIDDAYRNV